MTSPAIVVHGGWEAFGVADFSPACLKLKTYLRMVDLPYTTKLGDPRTAPTKKIPFVHIDADVIGDSGLIIADLKKRFGDKLDAKLTPAEHAIGHLVRRTCEESLYFPLLHLRWSDDAHFAKISPFLRAVMPPVIGGLIVSSIRKGTLGNTFAQGTGRHQPEHIVAHANADVDALADTLGDRPYLFGDAPSSYDASLFGTIANVLAFPDDGPIAKHARGRANLVAFVDRVKAKYWEKPDAKA